MQSNPTTTSGDIADLTHEEIVAILRRNRGSQSQIADSLGIRQTGVGLWLTGRTVSARIAEAAKRKALELRAIEQRPKPISPPEDAQNV